MARSISGLLRGETADELRLATGVNQEARIARREIEEIRPSTDLDHARRPRPATDATKSSPIWSPF